MSAGHTEPKPFQPILTPNGRELFPSYVPPHLSELSPKRREELFGHENAIMRINNPAHIGIPHSGSGHHPEQSKAERLASINTPFIEQPRHVGLRDEDVLDELVAAEALRKQAAEKLEDYNPRAFLTLRRWAVNRALRSADEDVSAGLEDYLTSVQLATAVQYGLHESADTAASSVKKTLLDPKETYKQGKDAEIIRKLDEIKGGRFGDRIAHAPHLRNSRKDKRLIERMRIRRHGRIDHGSGSMATDFGSEHFDHTIHALDGSEVQDWDNKASGHGIDGHKSHGISDRPDIARSIRKYQRFQRRAEKTAKDLTFKETLVKRGVVGEVRHRAGVVQKTAGKIGKLEKKREVLDAKIAAKNSGSSGSTESTRPRLHVNTVVTPQNVEVRTLDQMLYGLNGSLRIIIQGELYENGRIVAKGRVNGQEAYQIEYTDQNGTIRLAQISAENLKRRNLSDNS